MDKNIENTDAVSESENDSIEDIMENTTPESVGISALAVTKIAEELKNFKGGNKETAVSEFVASTLTKFCEENERFAEVVYKTKRTLSNCCAEVMNGCGNAISDIDVYRGAVQSYFPNADIHFLMEITITGDEPSAEELNREPKSKVQQTRAQHQPKAKPEKPQPAAKTSVKPALAPPASLVTKPTAPKEPKIETLQLTLF